LLTRPTRMRRRACLSPARLWFRPSRARNMLQRAHKVWLKVYWQRTIKVRVHAEKSVVKKKCHIGFRHVSAVAGSADSIFPSSSRGRQY
jgi:hypothetical protein